MLGSIINKLVVKPVPGPQTPAKPAPAKSAAPAMAPDRGPASIWSGLADGRPVRWTRDDIRVGPGPCNADTVSLAALVRQAIDAREGFDPGTDVEIDARLKSLVGPIASLQLGDLYMAKGAAHPDGERGFYAVDLRHPDRPARLDDYFEPEQIRQALLADPAVKKALAAAGMKTAPASLPELVTALRGTSLRAGERSYGFGAHLLEHFAFQQVDGKRVAVRLALPSDVGADRDGMTQLGVWLPIPDALAKDFAAAKQAGTLGQQFDRIPAGQTMHLAYATAGK